MSKIMVLLAEGFEELEAFAPVDLLRRAGAEVQTVSITETTTVTGARGIPAVADRTLSEADFEQMDLLILPGGYPGYVNLGKSEAVRRLILKTYESGKTIAAICGAPSVLGALGLLKDKKATCYPGMEQELHCKEVLLEKVVEDGNIITSRGAGTAIDFALKLIERVISPAKAKEVGESIVYQ
ncbi:MAG: DJ-1/PfpI family protein [Clostridia bacterium]|nr:DJ-1/PfpI family protein [Clostridia bacterium]